jgi:hypothetical protein
VEGGLTSFSWVLMLHFAPQELIEKYTGDKHAKT